LDKSGFGKNRRDITPRYVVSESIMDPRILSTIGLIFGIIGVLIVFVWGPPQPILSPGISLGLENGTPIDDTGKTVAEYNRDVAKRRKSYTRMSSFGLILIMIGFALQLWAVWLPAKTIKEIVEAESTQILGEFKSEKPKSSQDNNR